LRLGQIRAQRRDHWNKARRITVQRAFWRGTEDATRGWNRRTVPLTERLHSALLSRRHLIGLFVLCDPDGKPLTLEQMRWNLPRRHADLSTTLRATCNWSRGKRTARSRSSRATGEPGCASFLHQCRVEATKKP
jgi:hypothetical protein